MGRKREREWGERVLTGKKERGSGMKERRSEVKERDE